MTQPTSYKYHAGALLALGLPLVGSHLAQFAIQITDMVMLGWYDVTALAAVTLAGSFFFVVFIVGSGFAWAVMPMVARAAEQGDEVRIRRVTRMGLWSSLLYAMIFLPPLLLSGPIFLAIGQDPEVSAQAQIYLRIAGWGLFPGLVIMLLKAYLSALERTGVQLWVTLVAAGANVVVNYALIFGNWGAPELGIQGAAIASVLVQMISVIGLAFYAQYSFPQFAIFQRIWRVDRGALSEVFYLGYPIGLTSLAESGLFSASAVMIGWIGPMELAAHGIALQLTATTFMVHVGLSQAATVRAGRAYGRMDEAGLRRGGHTAFALSMCFVLVTIALFLGLPETLISLFLSADEPQRIAIIALGTSLLVVATLFQFVDAAQVIALGLLRGVEDTKVPMIYAVVSYWVLGMPASYLLGFTFGFGSVGVWAGLVVGLSAASVLLLLRFWTRSVRITSA